MLFTPSLCHKLSHLLGPPPPLERDVLYGRPQRCQCERELEFVEEKSERSDRRNNTEGSRGGKEKTMGNSESTEKRRAKQRAWRKYSKLKKENEVSKSVSLTCIVCKVMERIIKSDMTEHLAEYNVINNSQHHRRRLRGAAGARAPNN